MLRSLWTQLERLMRLVSSYHVAQVAPGGGHQDVPTAAAPLKSSNAGDFNKPHLSLLLSQLQQCHRLLCVFMCV